jgi:hypothetical protein
MRLSVFSSRAQYHPKSFFSSSEIFKFRGQDRAGVLPDILLFGDFYEIIGYSR